MKKSMILLFLCLFQIGIKGQTSQELEAYNTYISFLNECTHGLAIAKTLLDNNNRDLNRYIDLPSAKTVDINNDDLPSNYFDKPDDDSEFYTISPIELSRICKTKSSSLNNNTAGNLNRQVDNIVSILNQINQIRFDLESYTENHDLNEKESIYGVYEYLEKAVKLFNDYANAHKQLANDITKNGNSSELYQVCDNIHTTTKSILRNMRRENESNVQNNISKLQSDLAKFKSHVDNNVASYNSADAKYYIETIQIKTYHVIDLVKKYSSPGTVPFQQELYGKHYYYHNQLLSKYFNFTGPGFVRDMNKLLSEMDINAVDFDEEPLLFKVIYPVKIQEANTLAIQQKDINKESVEIKNNLEFSTIEEPKADTPVSEPAPAPQAIVKQPIEEKPIVSYDRNILILKIFDYSMSDRDSIRISLNGTVILDNYQMSLVPENFEFPLDPNGENTLLVEALNNGIMAPNTPSILVRRSGERKRKKYSPKLMKNQRTEIKIE
jgi:hypothetical protein